jgi:hypothetical protein
MSSDLLVDCDDNKGTGIYLSTNVHGFARVYIIGNNEGDDFELTPDKQGFENAEKIISALQEWVRHNNG